MNRPPKKATTQKKSEPSPELDKAIPPVITVRPPAVKRVSTERPRRQTQRGR